MKAISLWQPWASAIILGIKTIETRGWQTRHRGPLLIHSAKQWTPELRSFLADAQNKSVLPGGDYPLGALLGCVSLDAIETTEDLKPLINAIER